MSTIEVNKITPVDGGTSLQIGDAGDTTNIVGTLQNNGASVGVAGIDSSADATAITIDSSENVNIGATTNAGFGPLQVGDTSDSNSYIQMLSSVAGQIHFGDSTSGDGRYIGAIQYRHDEDVMKFKVNVAERMNIDSSGRVNINTASAITGEGVLQVSGNSGQNLSAWRVATNGVVGLRFFNSSTQGVGGITINASGTVYATSSDYRLKENEVAISDGIERLKQLKPYKFNFKTEPDTIVDGFFAHEVSSVVPEAVSGEKDATETYIDDNGDEQTRINSQGIDQSKLVPLLTSALQEAITKIETLEARVQALENA